MTSNELQWNADHTAYDLFTDWRARRDERAYTILAHVQTFVETFAAYGKYTPEVVRAVQLDVMAAQLAIDVARQTEGI